MSNMSREVYDPGTKVADFRKMRVTDLKDNPHVHLPRPRPPEEERLLEAKGVIRENIFNQYKDQNCIEKGYQKDTNLSKEQIRSSQIGEQSQVRSNNHSRDR